MLGKIVTVIYVCCLLGALLVILTLFARTYNAADDQGREDLIIRALGGHPHHITFSRPSYPIRLPSP